MDGALNTGITNGNRSRNIIRGKFFRPVLMAVVCVAQSQFLKQSKSTFGIPGQIVLFPFHYEYHNLMGNFIEIIIIRSDNNNGDDVGNGNNFSYTGGQVRRYRRWGRTE